MLLTTSFGATYLESSPYATLLLRSPAVGSEPPTRHGPKPLIRPTPWERGCRLAFEIEAAKAKKVPYRNGRPFSRLAFMASVREAYHGNNDGFFLPHTEEVENSSSAGIDPDDEAGRWLAAREEEHLKHAAA